jgi:hypothetical protein
MNKDVRILLVTVYLFLMAAFLYVQPDIAFGREGRIRPFGTQEKEATVFPLWWWIFVIAVVSYMITFFVTRSQMFQ